VRSQPQLRALRRIQYLVCLWSGTLMMLLAIFVFATIPGEKGSDLTLGVSNEVPSVLFWKAGHLFGFALFAGFLTLAASATFNQNIPGARIKAVVIIVGILMAITTELLQSFVPGHIPAIYDIGIDVAGTALGIKFAILWRK